MSYADVCAIREMLVPGAQLQVTASQVETVLPGRRQVVVERLDHGVMTLIMGGQEPTTQKSFIPIGCTIGPTDAEWVAGPDEAEFVNWHQAAPDKSRITYKLVDTVFRSFYKTQDTWHFFEEGSNWANLANRLYDKITDPGPDLVLQDAVIVTKRHLEAHPEFYPGLTFDAEA
jgi:hypothetical protein